MAAMALALAAVFASPTVAAPAEQATIIPTATLRVGSTNRTYRAALPPSARNGNLRRPVVVAFHGFGDTKDLMPIYSGLDDFAKNHGAIVVYPQSRPGAWPLVLDWAQPDFEFFDALIDELDRLYRIDRTRIYVVGMSNGAYFTHLLAWQRSTMIAAVAAHSGGLGALALTNVPPARKYAVMIIHGTADRLVRVREARSARAYYQERGHPVQYAEIRGLKHGWARKQGINEQIWSFFAQHQLQ